MPTYAPLAASVMPELPHLNCAVCLRDIPASEAQSSEARDYVAAVCGLECYAQWRAQTDPAAAQAVARPPLSA